MRKGEPLSMETFVKELLRLLEDEVCDFERCRSLIRMIGGCTQIIEGKYGLKTTPLHEIIYFGHYDLALELIGGQGENYDVDPDGWGRLIFHLQYLDSETEEKQLIESEKKLLLIQALINSGADPNPKEGGEDLLSYIRFKIGENDETPAQLRHLCEMERIIEACE